MFEKYYNMGLIDRLLRFVAGWAMMYIALFHADIIDDSLLNNLIGLFGLLNVVSSIARVCPAYLLAKISTIRKSAGRPADPAQITAGGSESSALHGNRMLRRKLQFSVLLPMLALLLVFGAIAYDLDQRFELATFTRQVDLAALLTARQHQQTLNQSAETSLETPSNRTGEFSAAQPVHDMVSGSELFLHHDSRGRPVSSSSLAQTDNADLLREWAGRARSLLPAAGDGARGIIRVGQQKYIWSATPIEGRNEWVTGIIKSPDHHTISDYFLSYRFLVLMGAVMWLTIWSSTYIVKLFVDKMEHNAIQLHRRSTHDALTGLPNRQKIESIVGKHLQSVNKGGECVVIIMIDIIDFRVVNDTLGYTLGDQLLVQVGELLREVEPDKTDLVRMGGDIFCLVCLASRDQINTGKLVNSLHDKLERSHELNGIPVGIQIRTGQSVGPADSGNPEDLVRFADIALAQAKNQRVKDCFYQHEQNSHSIRKLALLARLGTAIDQDELTLVYQPKVNIGTQTLAGVEVLVRWHDAEYGAVSPVEFVSWAERSGLIDKLTHWVLTTAEKQCREWRDQGYLIPFAVNVSPTNLYDMKLIPLLSSLMEEGSFGDGMLELEITENAIMENPDNALQTMSMLDSMGAGFAIDDFGTGLSSFAYLRTLPVSNLKIDRAFIIDTHQSDKDAVLLRSMIKLGHGLGCIVTAEGVEDEQTLDRLREYGCDVVQGYHVCRPVPADELIRWVQSCEWQTSRRAA